MGKIGVEEEQALPTNDDTSDPNEETRSGGCGFNSFRRIVGLRCVLVLLLSAAVFLSAVFWLPPFLHFADQGDLDLDPRFKDHDIVAIINVRKPVAFLEENILQLEDDIFDEISSPTSTKVVILSLEPSAAANITKVVFGVDPDAKYSKLSSTALSLIRANFEFLVVNQSFRLTPSVFGDPFSFEVLKFPGGITIIPPQTAFLLQKVQILFNFTLNFSIYQVQINFAELTTQLKSGLHLASYENLYISLSNTKGSTVAPPTTVQSSVVLAVGNTPSMGRLKQLAQTITGHSRNLGLNNTVFGKVKQVRLSSILQHSLHGGEGSASPSPSPAPVPQPHHHRRRRHHRRRHHRHHHHDPYQAPAISPAPAPVDHSPAPLKSSPAPQNSKAKPPGCQLGHIRSPGNSRKQSYLTPMVAPSIPPHFSTASPSPVPYIGLPPSSPTRPPLSRAIPASSPSPNVIFAHAQPPSKAESEEHSDTTPSVSPLPSVSPSSCFPTLLWAFSLSLPLVLCL